MAKSNPLKSRWPTLAALLDLCLPRRCAACDEPLRSDDPLCHLCLLTLEPVTDPCPRCGLPNTGAVCLGCLQRPPPFAAAAAPLAYGGQLAVALRRLKYGARPHLAPALARLLAPAFTESQRLAPADLLLPVPLHPSRLRRRGYNQAALLLARLAPLAPGRVSWGALLRVRPGPSQAALGRRARLRNLGGAFRARPDAVAGARVLLLDDVMTTGATAAACARALLDGGASEVRVLTLARAMP